MTSRTIRSGVSAVRRRRWRRVRWPRGDTLSRMAQGRLEHRSQVVLVVDEEEALSDMPVSSLNLGMSTACQRPAGNRVSRRRGGSATLGFGQPAGGSRFSADSQPAPRVLPAGGRAEGHGHHEQAGPVGGSGSGRDAAASRPAGITADPPDADLPPRRHRLAPRSDLRPGRRRVSLPRPSGPHDRPAPDRRRRRVGRPLGRAGLAGGWLPGSTTAPPGPDTSALERASSRLRRRHARRGRRPRPACQSSVVSIETTVQVRQGPFVQEGEGAGTGIVLDDEGYILTNAHV